MSGKKFRLVTRSDFDGLVCATLLRELEMIDDIVFVHPKDMQDGKIAVTAKTISPPICPMWTAFISALTTMPAKCCGKPCWPTT